MDGSFVPRYGLYPELLGSIRKLTKLPIDVHLMIVDPERYVRVFIDSGATVVTIHAEACVHVHRALATIRNAGAKVGIALNYSTPLAVLEYILDDVDLVLLMGINPGILGHKLIPKTLDKIAQMRNMLHNTVRHVIIEIDGGVTFQSAPRMYDLGADLLVCGSATIFRPNTLISDNVKELRSLMRNAALS